MVFRIQVFADNPHNSCDFNCQFDSARQAAAYIRGHAKRVGYMARVVIIQPTKESTNG